MAHSQPARTPKLNALLIGKRTVPSGCQVLNVSQQGMSLRCDPDGRLLTFVNGDSVDIYLSVQHSNGNNKFTIPAVVSHVDEDTIDVTFHCTDPELAGLIESYRTSKSHNLKATIDHRQVSKRENPDEVVRVGAQIASSESPRKPATPSFYTVLFASFLASLLLLGAWYYISGINKRLNTLETISRAHTEELADVQTQVFSARLQEGRYASLNARMKALTDAFQSFEKRVSQAMSQKPVVITTTKPEQSTEQPARPREPLEQVAATGKHETVPHKAPGRPAPATDKAVAGLPPVPAKAAPVASDKQQAAVEAGTPSVQKYPVIEAPPVKPVFVKPARTATVKAPATEGAPTVSAAAVETAARPVASTVPDTTASKPAVVAARPVKARVQVTQPAVVAGQKGPWVINLLSSIDKADVDSAMENARSLGIDAVVTSATVKGRQYWRLQVPGFRSLSAARAAAGPIKAKLGIKDVWYLKRRR